MDAKICQVQIGMTIGVNCVIMSQEKKVTYTKVVIDHGNPSAAIRNVEKCVRNPVINAKKLQFA